MKLRGQLEEHEARWSLFAGLDALSGPVHSFLTLSPRHGQSIKGAEDREQLVG